MDIQMRLSNFKNNLSPALRVIPILFVLICCCRPALGTQTTVNLLAKAMLSPKSKERVSAYKVISEYQCPSAFCLQTIQSHFNQEIKNNFGFSEEPADPFSTWESNLSRNSEELSCMCKVLAFTSDPDCRTTLERVYSKLPTNIRLKGFAEKCLKISDAYAKTALCWSTSDTGDTDCEVKSVCMIESPHPTVRVTGAKHIFWSLGHGDGIYRRVDGIITNTLSQIETQNNPEDNSGFPNGLVTVPNSTQEFLSWLSKSLGISGNPRYRKTLLEVLEKSQRLQFSKLIHHTQRALQLLKQTSAAYRQMDTVNKKHPHLSNTDKKIICLIKSPFPYLKSFAAQHVYWSPAANRTVIDIINSETLAKLNEKQLQYETAASQADNFQDKTTVFLASGEAEILAWYCKILKATGDSKYLPTLNLAVKIASVTMSRKLKNALQ
jgi:hypothetical protein